MAQLAYNINQGVANPGMLADASVHVIDSFQAFEVISLGVGLVKRKASDTQVRLPKANKSTVVFAGDLVTSNTINMKVNGVAMAQVTFSSTHLATMNLILAALVAMTTQVASAVLDTTDTNNRTILVRSVDGLNAIVTEIVVAAGSTQTTGTATTGTWDSIDGISVSTMAKEETFITLLMQFSVGEAVPSLRKGRIFVLPEVAVTSDDAVYCRFLGNGTTTFAGSFRNDADAGTAVLVPYAKFRSAGSSTVPAVVEINLP